MRPSTADVGYLWDILEAGRGVVATVERLGFEQYRADENLRLATERRIEIIGEAANLAHGFPFVRGQRASPRCAADMPPQPPHRNTTATDRESLQVPRTYPRLPVSPVTGRRRK